jgi:hypothetical protein
VVANVAKYLVKNFSAGLGLTLGNHQRRVNANSGEIAHHQQSAFECFFEDNFHYRAAELAPGRIVTHQVEAEQESASANVTDEFLFFLELQHPTEQRRADTTRILDELFLANRLDRFCDRNCRQGIAAVTRR